MPRDTRAETLLVRELSLHPLTARLLVNRGLSDPAEAEAFLHPKLADLHDPFGLPDLDKAARRIADAVTRGETILVHGDYDVDGVTSTALYVRALGKLGGKVIYKIPHRHQEGYDLREAAIEHAQAQGASLIVTTDCGIQAREAVEYANSVGLTVIITDHHEPGETLPNAYAVVNPRRHDSKYPFPALAGVGVAYKTMQAVTRLLKPEWEAAFVQNFLDLVAMGTVADVMPLLGENRVLATFGLEALRRTKKVGVRALLEGAGIDTTVKLSPDAVGFGLAPRINAVGRLGDAGLALELLLTADAGEAQQLVQQLNECNRERQVAQKRVQAEAVMRVITQGLADKPVLMVRDRNWNAGVIGIVAGKLVEQFHRPAIVVAESADGSWGKGSGRSIPAFDLYQGIAYHNGMLETCGGHSQAAGLSLMMNQYDTFYDMLCRYAGERLKPEDFLPRLQVDAVVSGCEITMGLLEEWEQLAPHGHKNPAPLLASKKLRVCQKRRMGKDLAHLKLCVDKAQGVGAESEADAGKQAEDNPDWQTDCVGWGIANEWDARIEAGQEIDIAYAPSINRYNGKSMVQFVIKDLTEAGEAPLREGKAA